MADTITPYAIIAPGNFGVNTQDSPIGLDDKYALEAINCVIDQYGRIGARKGWAKAHTSNSDLSTSNITCIGEVVQIDGTRTLVAAGGAYLFKHSSTTLTTLTYGGGGSTPTISASNWQFAALNGIGYFFQRGYDPLIFDPAVSTTTFRRVSEKTGYAGSIPTAHVALSAYGRLWVADTSTDKSTVTWSDVITGHIWTGGSSGSLDVRGVWPQGADEIVGIAAHNNFLYIFGKRQILIYSGATTPSSMTLYDTVHNIGCIARDSIVNTGEDVIFLSSSGVRSLMRTIQEKSAPLRTVSKNIYDDLIDYLALDNTDNIKAGYSQSDAFYLLTLPASSIVYCFDTRQMMQDGASRVTSWNNNIPKAIFYSASRTLYFGQAGYIGSYTGYYDNDSSSYRLSYYTPWIDFGNPIQTSILKKIILTILGATNQDIVSKWDFDFSGQRRALTVTLSGVSGTSEYTVIEYGIGEYNGNLAVTTVTAQAGGSGKLLQVGFEAQVQGYPLSFQKIELYTKDGRL